MYTDSRSRRRNADFRSDVLVQRIGNVSALAPLLRTIAAILCLCLGVVGLVLPLIPGIPLLIVGALLLRRRRYRASGPAVRDSGLTTFEQLELQFWLLARRITSSAESIRLSRRARARQRNR